MEGCAFDAACQEACTVAGSACYVESGPDCTVFDCENASGAEPEYAACCGDGNTDPGSWTGDDWTGGMGPQGEPMMGGG